MGRYKNRQGPYTPELPPGLEQLLKDYQQHGKNKGLREGSIAQYQKECRWFLRNLADCGCTELAQISASSVITACLALTSKSYLASTRTLLRYCADSKQTDRDYSYVIPPYKRPQPMPSVYTESEIFQMESAINRGYPVGIRDYAIVLLGTRLGLRLEDIRTMSFDKLDFENDAVHLVQEKTLAELMLPMVPELKNALLDYINNARPDVDGVVFRVSYPPYDEMTKNGVVACYRRALKNAGIKWGERGFGPRAFRSSLASSMVNDNVPYDAVRKTLGHIDINAIKHYARLDIEQLRLYALPVPEATGAFADFLAGRRSM